MTGIAHARKDRIVELARDGHGPKVIAGIVGTAPANVSYWLRRARDEGVDIPHFDVGSPPEMRGMRRLFVAPATLVRLTAAAGRRRITPHALAARILDRAVEDRLIDAVLDDGVSSDA